MKRRVSFKKQAHYAGSVGCMVLAGGPWGVIRAVTGRITQCLSSVATSPGGEVEEGTGNGWEVLDPCWELLGLSVSQGDLGLDGRDRKGRTARANYLCSGEGPLIFGSLL